MLKLMLLRKGIPSYPSPYSLYEINFNNLRIPQFRISLYSSSNNASV